MPEEFAVVGTVILDPAPSDAKQVRRHAELPVMPVGTWTAADWDGRQFAIDQPDVVASPDGSITATNLPVIHPVYLYAKYSPSRFADYAAMFPVQQNRASALLTGAAGSFAHSVW